MVPGQLTRRGLNRLKISRGFGYQLPKPKWSVMSLNLISDKSAAPVITSNALNKIAKLSCIDLTCSKVDYGKVHANVNTILRCAQSLQVHIDRCLILDWLCCTELWHSWCWSGWSTRLYYRSIESPRHNRSRKNWAGRSVCKFIRFFLFREEPIFCCTWFSEWSEQLENLCLLCH